MIYLFGKGEEVSIVYDGNSLYEKSKENAIVIDKLPEKNTPKDHYETLCLDAFNKPYWKYIPIPKDTLEDLVRKDLLTSDQYKTLTGKDFVG
jgi:hypothetical protein